MNSPVLPQHRTFTMREKMLLSWTANGKFLQMIHENLKTNIISQDWSTTLLSQEQQQKYNLLDFLLFQYLNFMNPILQYFNQQQYFGNIMTFMLLFFSWEILVRVFDWSEAPLLERFSGHLKLEDEKQSLPHLCQPYNANSHIASISKVSSPHLQLAQWFKG